LTAAWKQEFKAEGNSPPTGYELHQQPALHIGVMQQPGRSTPQFRMKLLGNHIFDSVLAPADTKWNKKD
jgi:hypothetical protein